MTTKTAVVLTRSIENKIFLIRNQKVMLDSDLAELYETKTKVLIQSVKRNEARFPEDFMFQLTPEEFDSLRSQIVTSNKPGRGGRRYTPHAFTEQGVAMLSSVLKSERAVLVNVEIMRVFVRLRHFLASNEELARKFEKLEGKCSDQFKIVFLAINKLIAHQEALPAPLKVKKKPQIGFQPGEKGKGKN